VPVFVQFAILSLLAAAGLIHYWRMATRLPAPARPPVDFGKVDVAFAALLALWIIAQTIESFGKQLAITTEGINFSVIVYFGIVLLILGILVARDRDPIALFGLRWQGWPRGILVSLLSLLAAYPLIFVPVAIMNLAGIETESQDVVQYLGTAKGFAERFPMIFMAVVAAPISEEFIFRGYLHGVLRKYSGRWISIFVTSLIFAALHRHLPAMVPLFILAVALALVYEKTRSLWAPILMHAAFNSVTVVVALTWPDLMK
jgi:membrane protease YdiL (CAAX protease family)